MEANIEVREVTVADAAGMTALNARLSQETKFMLFEPDEVASTLGPRQDALRRVSASEDEGLFVAEADGRLVGFVAARRRGFNRVRHSFSIVIGIERAFWGRGLGRRLLREAEEWAKTRGARRLELTVLKHNERARRLYQAYGFDEEGIRRNSLLIDGEFLDEVYMGKLLPE